MLDERDLQAIAQLLDARMDAKLEPVRQGVDSVEPRLTGQRQELLREMETRMDEKIRASESRMMAYFEAAVMPKFDLLADGIQALQEKMPSRERFEEVEDRLDALEAAVRPHSKEIAGLKKAQ